MEHKATFRFNKSLNDFLSPPKRNARIPYSFHDNPSVKDAIEALGVPHPEVHTIVANNSKVGFDYKLQNNDEIEVYPYEDRLKAASINSQLPARFILDVHLGKLAKALRMLGFDTLYENNWNDRAIVELSEVEERIILTRNIGLLKHKRIQSGYWLRSQHLQEQIFEVIRYFNLTNQFQPFTRCLECNGTILLVKKKVY